VLVLAVLFMTVLLGMAALVIDVGQTALERRRLQNAVDAGVLAGVQALPLYPSQATASASTWATNNDVEAGELTAVALSQTNVTNDTITVSAKRTVPFVFGRVLGKNSQDVTATARAVVGSVKGGTGVMPFGLVDLNGASAGFGYNFNQQIALREVPGNHFGPGNYGFLALDGKGGSDLRETIARGGSLTLYQVGDEVLTEPGQKNGPLSQGLAQWAASNGDSMGSSCDNFVGNRSYVNGKLVITKKCEYRVILIPIIDHWPNGRKEVTILGFAQVYLAGMNEGDGKRLDAYFLNDTFYHPEIVFGAVDSYGTRVTKLLQ
jgi:hypothetical protein